MWKRNIEFLQTRYAIFENLTVSERKKQLLTNSKAVPNSARSRQPISTLRQLYLDRMWLNTILETSSSGGKESSLNHRSEILRLRRIVERSILTRLNRGECVVPSPIVLNIVKQSSRNARLFFELVLEFVPEKFADDYRRIASDIINDRSNTSDGCSIIMEVFQAFIARGKICPWEQTIHAYREMTAMHEAFLLFFKCNLEKP